MKTREYQYDNLRFLLIALVVLGHLLEIAGEFPHKETLYAVIYSFHMPAFLFLSGMFARFDRSKWIFGMALPYLVLQWLYTAFVEKLGDPWVHVQFSRPYWILWYLFVLAIYTLLLPVYDAPSPTGRWLMVAASVALALLAGFDRSIDYQWSASRLIAFQPWFLLGYYFRRVDGLRARWNGGGRTLRGIVLGLAAACCVVLEWLLLRQGVTAKMMLGGQCDFSPVRGPGPSPQAQNPGDNCFGAEYPVHLSAPRLFLPSASAEIPLFAGPTVAGAAGMGGAAAFAG